ncbi:integrase core domain-containing protein, partial [Dokdonella sp.]
AHSSERTAHLARWQHYYNHHRRHSALGDRPPISRIPLNNLSNLNT